MNDTTPDIQRRMAAMIAARSPAERLRMASSLFDTGRTLLRIGLLKQNESLNEGQLRAQIFQRIYAEDFTVAEIKEIASRIPNMILDDESQAALSL
ncbi:MAG: hypothetical protein ACYDGS_00270 [Thermoleophilia bacterium]